MCLDIKFKNDDPERDLIPKIAKRDIICYKVCREVRCPNEVVYHSIYYGGCYEIGKIRTESYFTWGIDASDKVIQIDKGLHSINSLKYALLEQDKLSRCEFGKIVILQCVIPKGTAYYTGKYTFYKSRASLALRPIKIIQ